MADAMTTNGATSAAAGRQGGGLKPVLVALRVILVLVLANAALNLAASAGGNATPATVFDKLVHGDLWGMLSRMATPAAAVDAVRTWPSVTLALWVSALVLVTAGVLWMRVGAVAGLLLAVVLLILTLRSTGADLWADLASANPLLLALGVALYGGAILITVVRWRMLLAVQGIDVPLWALARLTLIGVFFNLAIPGAVSGDLVKMGYLTARTADRKAEGVLTILVDRIIGMLGLFIVAAVSVLCALPLLAGLDERYRPLKMAAATVALGSLGGVTGVLLVEFRAALVRHPLIARIVALGARLLPAKACALLARLVAALELYRNTRMTIVKATLLAIAVHALLALDMFTLGKAVGEESLGLHHYFVTTCVANAVASIPVTPGGVGTRDKTTAAFLSAFDAQPPGKAGSIPVVLSLVIVFWAFAGAGVFVCTTRHPPA